MTDTVQGPFRWAVGRRRSEALLTPRSVKEESADFGVAVDPDVDRCVLIDETGTPLGEEYTLAIAVKFYLEHAGKRGVVCNNLSSSRVVNDICAQYEGCSCVSAAVGEINVAKRMVELGAVIGGEGNGGVMLPDVHIGRDAPVAAGLVLACMAEHGGSLAELKASLPQYDIVKTKCPIEGLNKADVLAAIRAEYADDASCTINDVDGVRIDHPDWWVHIRGSNTEPVVRVIGEAGNYAESEALCKRFMDKISAMRQ